MFHNLFQEKIQHQKDDKREEEKVGNKNDTESYNKNKKRKKEQKKGAQSCFSALPRSAMTTNTGDTNNTSNTSDDINEVSDIFTPKKSIKASKQSTQQNTNRKSSNPNYNPSLSEEALKLSSRLKILSSQKQFQTAIELYNAPHNNKIRDGYHACIMIDCSSRCGRMDVGEKILNSMKSGKGSSNGGSKMCLSIQAYTALLKGYVHCGWIEKATSLFYELCVLKNDAIEPNVRTLNTLLRGCQWSATTTTSRRSKTEDDNECTYKVTGGVISSEYAWELISSNPTLSKPFFDVSSYEYSINILSQSLQIDNAIQRFQEMKQQLSLPSAEEEGGEQPVPYESYAFCYYYIMRGLFVLLQYSTSKKHKRNKKLFLEYSDHALDYVDMALASYNNTSIQDRVSNHNAKSSNQVSGGKRAWKKKGATNDDTTTNALSASRTSSNVMFRSHRLNELKNDILSIIQNYHTTTIATHKEGNHENDTKKSNALIFWLLTRFLYISGGGTTTDKHHHKKEDVRMQMLLTLWISYGVSVLVGRSAQSTTTTTTDTDSNTSTITINKLSPKDLKCIRIAISAFVGNKQEARKLFGNEFFDNAGFLNFYSMFQAPDQNKEEDHQKEKKKIHVELGAGSGDWIISQAQRNPNDNYIAVDLRADRVYQTFSKATTTTSTNLLWNLSCVGCDSLHFLQHYIPRHSLATIYVNHPEPPTQIMTSSSTSSSYNSTSATLYTSLLQTNTNNNSEPSHMLSSKTIQAITQRLLQNGGGRLIIVTDNVSYAKLLCITILKVNRNKNYPYVLQTMNEADILQNENHTTQSSSLEPFEIFEDKQSHMVEPLQPHEYNNHPTKKTKYSNKKNNKKNKHQKPKQYKKDAIILYKGYPCESIGHYPSLNKNKTSGGVSYFDRLWRTGIGSKYAEVDKRYILALKTCSTAAATATATATATASSIS